MRAVRACLSRACSHITVFETGSGTAILDSSGNGSDGVAINGPTWVTGKIGTGMQFDGSNDMVQIGTNSDSFDYMGGDLSATFWAWIDASSVGGMFSRPWNGSGEYNWELSSAMLSSLYGNPGSVTVSGPSPSTGQWNFCAMVFNGASKTIELYIGSSRVSYTHSVSNYSPALGDGGEKFVIGSKYPYPEGFSFPAAYCFKGIFDEMKFYNRVLSSQEIEACAQGYCSPIYDNIRAYDYNKVVWSPTSLTCKIRSADDTVTILTSSWQSVPTPGSVVSLKRYVQYSLGFSGQMPSYTIEITPYLFNSVTLNPPLPLKTGAVTITMSFKEQMNTSLHPTVFPGYRIRRQQNCRGRHRYRVVRRNMAGQLYLPDHI